MTPIDIPALTERLTTLGEVLGAKPLAHKGAALWFDTLREFPSPVVFDVLDSWARSHGRFPVPADVWRECSDLAASRAEKQRVADRMADDAMARGGREPARRTQYGMQCAAALREFARTFGRRPPNKDWARRIVDAHAAVRPLTYRNPVTGEVGALEPVTEYALAAAREALGPLAVAQRERVPGEDDE